MCTSRERLLDLLEGGEARVAVLLAEARRDDDAHPGRAPGHLVRVRVGSRARVRARARARARARFRVRVQPESRAPSGRRWGRRRRRARRAWR